MKSLSQSAFLRLVTFSALYLAQGIPWGFISVGYIVFLSDLGLDNTAVGKAMSIAYLPWSFKVLWGPLLDRFPTSRLGRRRPFILLAELLMGLSILALIPLDPKTHLGAISAVLFFHNAVASLQDVAVDALAVDLLAPEERGRANAFMWAAKAAGIALGGGGGVLVAKHFGWSWLFAVLAASLWLIMLLPLFLRERPHAEPSAVPEETRLNWQQLVRSFNFSTTWWGLAIALLVPAGYAMVGAASTRLFRVELKLSEEAIATLSGVVDPLSGVAGALLGGFLADRLGVRRAITVALGVVALSLALFGALPSYWHAFPFLVMWTVVFNLAVNSFSASSLSLFMGLSNPAIGATHFALFMAATNLCYSLTATVGGAVADGLGYTGLYFVAAGVQLAALPLIRFARPEEARVRYLQVTRPPDAPLPEVGPEAASGS